MKFSKGQSGNPGGRPKVLADVRELARHHTPAIIAELARLALKAKNETTRVAAIRELLDRGFGKPRQGLEITPPAAFDPIQTLLDDIAAASRNEERYVDSSIARKSELLHDIKES
jgi:DNA-binding transcriptional regulator PaaX